MRGVPDDARAATFSAALCAGSMIAHQVAAKAARDAFFLSTFDVTQLPRITVVSAIVSLVVVIGSARAMTALSPDKVVPRSFAVSALALLVQWPFASVAPEVVTVVFYLHTIVFGSVLTSGFWSMVNERFDPHTAKQIVGRIASGGTIGALVGGIIAERIGANLSLEVTFPFLAVLHLFSGWVVRDLRSGKRKVEVKIQVESGFGVLSASRYLQGMALLVALGTAAVALFDYVLKAEAKTHFTTGEDLVRFFAAYYALIGLVSFAVQSALSARVLERLGVGGTVALLPLVLGAGSLATALVPGMASIVVVRGAEGVLRTSLYRSAYELLYTPVSPSEKRATKSLIDVLCDRFGDVVGGSMVAVVIATASPEHARPYLLMAAGVLSAAAFVVSLRLQRGYVDALEKSLVQMGAGLSPESLASPRALAVDKVIQFTEHMLFDREQGVFLAPDPENMLTGTGLTLELSRGKTLSVPAPSLLIGAADRGGLLESGDPVRLRFALMQGDLPQALVPRAIRLLARNDVLPDVLAALRRVVDREVDRLVFALANDEEDFAVRRRLPRVLADSTSPRAVEGLTKGLFDRRFEVRYQCGRALAKMRSERIEKSRVLEAVEREVAVDRGLWESHRLLDAITPEDASGFADALVQDRANRSMEHVFRILSLVYPEEPLRVAYRGLFTEDAALRGTSLEYLESVLPETIRAKLWPFLDAKPVKKDRSREEVMADLLRSKASIMVKLEELEKLRNGGG
jgi:hypothetical protein